LLEQIKDYIFGGISALAATPPLPLNKLEEFSFIRFKD